MADELKATPVKHDWVLSVANALRSGRDFANKADVPVLGPMGDFLMGKAPEGLERIAYDEPMTTGKGWTTKLRPETVDLGFLAADVAPAAKATVGALRRTADAASTAAVKKITGNAAATPHGVVDEINQMNLMPAVFAGEKSKTANLKALEKAKAMDAAGHDAGAIRSETEWFKNPVGQWNYEIPDTDSKLLTKELRRGEVDEARNEVESLVAARFIASKLARGKSLDEATEKARQMFNVKIDDHLKSFASQFSPQELSKMQTAADEKMAAASKRGFTGERMGRHLSHPKLFEAYPELKDYTFNSVELPANVSGSFRDKTINLDNSLSTVDPYLNVRYGSGGARATEGGGRSTVLHELQHAIQQIENSPRGGNPNEFVRELRKKPDSGMTDDQIDAQAYKMYERLAGEVEARNVQHRLTLTPEELKAKHPFDTAEFPYNEQTIKYSNSDAYSNAESPAAPIVGALRKAPKKTKFQKAHDEAQINASLPVEEGGLGLPPDNTAAQRAEAMGARDWYHGTERLDRLLEKDSLNPKRATSGPMPFGTDEKELASNYASNKTDTSRVADDIGGMENYFTVSPKQLGFRGSVPYPVEKTFNFLSPEKKKELINNYYRIGYSDPEQGMGDFVLHPEGSDSSIASKSTLDYYLNREAKGNPLQAIRHLWGESGSLYDNEGALADLYKLAGYPHEISQANAPWYKANGVFTGKVMTQNPLMASNHQELSDVVVPHLEQAFANSRAKRSDYGVDLWDKNSRYTPKEWVDELRKDLSNGSNSYVWTSIPDKVTAELKKLGYDSIIDVSGKGGGKESEVIIPFAPNQVRSRFAAFDPKKRDSTNLLAGVGAFVPGTGALVGALREDPQQQ